MLPLSTGVRAVGSACAFLSMRDVTSYPLDERLPGIEGRDLPSGGGEIPDRRPILAKNRPSASGGFQQRAIAPVAGLPALSAG